MPEATLTIQLDGSLDDQGHVRLNEFIDELQAIKLALKHTERIITGKENTVYYRVIDLKHSSPAQVRISAVPQSQEYIHNPRRIVRRFSTSLRMIQRRHRIPLDFDVEATQAFRNIAQPLKKHLTRLTITEDEKKRESVVDRGFEATVDKLVGSDQAERGSISGMLEKVNLHGGANQFHIFPTVGARRVSCTFTSSDVRHKVEDSVGKYVRVDGWLVYRQSQKFPYSVRVTDVIKYPPVSELPTMSDLRGIAPDATGGLSSEDFIRKMRDGNW